MPLGAHKAAIMGVAGTAAAGDVVLLSMQTAEGDTSITFDSQISSTYGEYVWKWYDVNPANDNVNFGFQVNAAGQSGYNETVATTLFTNNALESGGTPALAQDTTNDETGTGLMNLNTGIGNGSDETCVGELHVFNPTNTSLVKIWFSDSQTYRSDNGAFQDYHGGFIDVTAAVTDFNFKMSDGSEFDGVMKLWGIK